ncbi:MAG: TIGR04283 family arsenosugar biosynthesis glycosyltransferase [Proteobacteria bacterium]|nr:TIGR04283 family arsenosugar biosynthesis glycosyltransferase [Pseudomonadota bacterium]
MPVPLSIIIPTLNEALGVAETLQRLAPMRRRGAEIILADGGSRDNTVEIARPFADKVIAAPMGRASQMNAGAAAARGDILLFLHADTFLPEGADQLVIRRLSASNGIWGRFDAKISSPHPLLVVVGVMMNISSRLSGIATGDQAIFVRRAVFESVGGFPAIALMEDIALSHILRRLTRPLCLREKVLTSARRWHENGVLSTIVLMWRLRIAYSLGADPRELARRYGYVPRAR